jgi:hypothetical protein
MKRGGHGKSSSVPVLALSAAGAGSSRSILEVRVVIFERALLALITILCDGVVEVAAVTVRGCEGTA